MANNRLTSYRFTNTEEPTDEELRLIMEAAAIKARKKNEAAEHRLHENVRSLIEKDRTSPGKTL